MKALELAGRFDDRSKNLEAVPGFENLDFLVRDRDCFLQAAAELRRLAAVEASILQAILDPENQPSQYGRVTLEKHANKVSDLTDKYCALVDRLSTLKAERGALKATFEHALAECRDAYPVPEVGSELEGLWGQAMVDPVSVGAYVSACAVAQKKEIDALKAENALLEEVNLQLREQNDAVGEACATYEAELERIRALEPVAWRTFDGEGGYDYRTYDMNESYAEDYAKRNPNHAHWVEPLYALGSKT